MGCSGISWTICKQSAPRSRQITKPTPHHSMFTGRMLFLTPNHQCQSPRSAPESGSDAASGYDYLLIGGGVEWSRWWRSYCRTGCRCVCTTTCDTQNHHVSHHSQHCYFQYAHLCLQQKQPFHFGVYSLPNEIHLLFLIRFP